QLPLSVIKLPSIIRNHESVAVSARNNSKLIFFNDDKTSNDITSNLLSEHSIINHQSLENYPMQPIIMTPDDNLNGMVQRPPEICVDYLSH
ncbi:29819_t:CDS:1, partial [Racocetra persica]